MQHLKLPALVLTIIASGFVFAACMGATTGDQPEATPNTPALNGGANMDESGTSMAADSDMAEMNIVETAQSAGSFQTLLAAAQAAGLAETLATTENITVFAPTDEAFAKLPAGTVEGLLEKPEELAEILKYHVVAGTVTAEQVVQLDSATTLQGSDVSISVMGDQVKVNQATVVQADVMASNGVIHVIDTVLLPE